MRRNTAQSMRTCNGPFSDKSKEVFPLPYSFFEAECDK